MVRLPVFGAGSAMFATMLATCSAALSQTAPAANPEAPIVPRKVQLEAPNTAAGAETPLALEIMLNGRPTGVIGTFIERDGALYATPAELKDLGFRVPEKLLVAKQIPVAELPGVTAKIDRLHQRLDITAAESALLPSELGISSGLHLATLAKPSWGGVLSFDALATYASGSTTGGSLVDARGFGPYGLLESTGVASIVTQSATSGLQQQPFTRLDTTYTYSEETELRRWRAGDIVTGALGWSRSVRLGGAQLARDFSLRPDIITYPYPGISSSAAVPSSVDVFVNGIRQFSEQVQPGPFSIRTLPFVGGAGEVTVATTDALGRQTFATMPIYTSLQLLRPGLTNYSVEAGSVRQLYGVLNDKYAGWAGNGSLRYGATDWLTLESHGEATDGLDLAGVGAAVQVGLLGTATVAVAGSAGRGHAPFGPLPGVAQGPAAGGLVSAGVQRLSRRFSVSLSATAATPGYRDIAAVNGAPVPRLTLNASLGVPLGQLGGVGVALTEQRGGKPTVATAPANINFNFNPTVPIYVPGATSFSIATASYNVALTDRLGLYATTFASLIGNHDFGAAIGLTYSFGVNTSGSASVNFDRGRPTGELAAQKSVFEQNDWGFLVQDSEGFSTQRQGQLDYLSRYGYVAAGVSQVPGTIATRGEYRAALAYVDGDVLIADAIPDAFAVVKTGDVGGVPVLSQNRPYGKTDTDGVLLLPNLLSYQNNILAIDPAKLPADIDVTRTRMIVRPPDHAGIVVNFPVSRVHGALLKLLDQGGKPIPLGSAARLENGRQEPVGFEGETYITGLAPHNRLGVQRPDGRRCHVEFDYRAKPGEIPVIGPLTCIEE